MAQKPYEVANLKEAFPIVQQYQPQACRCSVDLSGTPNGPDKRESVIIVTHVPAPYPTDPQELLLTALRRVRDLLDEQIAAMRSP
jgi:hypothetical protein